MEKTNNNSTMMKDFIELNTPEVIDRTISDIENICDTLVFHSGSSCEDIVNCLRSLYRIKGDYNELRNISMNYHNENEA